MKIIWCHYFQMYIPRSYCPRKKLIRVQLQFIESVDYGSQCLVFCTKPSIRIATQLYFISFVLREMFKKSAFLNFLCYRSFKRKAQKIIRLTQLKNVFIIQLTKFLVILTIEFFLPYLVRTGKFPGWYNQISSLLKIHLFF